MPYVILSIELCPAFHEEADQGVMAGKGSLMEWGGMGMPTDGVVAVRIFAHIQQRSDYLDATEL
jgi:hypothetical protein